jgi:mRNA-degrading endonuclease YafQ of YafQ-DinJ toxin-antitoxin module
MAYNLVITERFEEKLAKFLKKHPELMNQYLDTMALLEANPYHNSLRLHKLTGKLNGLSSVSINNKYRITIEFIIDDKEIIPIDVSNHYQ